MLDRRVRQGRYPRRTIVIDIAHMWRKPLVLAERARVDRIYIMRAGKRQVVMVHPVHLAMLTEQERRTQRRSRGRQA
ncbi:hypothetical protein [Novosphingobium sp. KA1]|uniref:hypothetical protein n=1 Tax=Novosphingobium sp. (strain KA1) TaxID=164608 RepID=UPI001A8C724E|nr:hypothetical protein [Novosphingobium sp. KA1]QSR17349.1 hypothetical protein CA833_09160 [Novosphingobium sp. KA1]